jgi:hypothetical protein
MSPGQIRYEYVAKQKTHPVLEWNRLDPSLREQWEHEAMGGKLHYEKAKERVRNRKIAAAKKRVAKSLTKSSATMKLKRIQIQNLQHLIDILRD